MVLAQQITDDLPLRPRLIVITYLDITSLKVYSCSNGVSLIFTASILSHSSSSVQRKQCSMNE